MRIEILNAAGEVINTIIAAPEVAEQQFPGMWRVCAVQDDHEAPKSPRHISVGAFYDRFGPAKYAILADESLEVRAVVRDASIRKYIDLDNPRLLEGLAKLRAAGHDIDPALILGDPILPEELP